jgi:hypothetical protein
MDQHSKYKVRDGIFCLTVSPAVVIAFIAIITGDLPILGDHNDDCKAFIPSHLGPTAQNSTVDMGGFEYFDLSCPDILSCQQEMAGDR